MRSPVEKEQKETIKERFKEGRSYERD